MNMSFWENIIFKIEFILNFSLINVICTEWFLLGSVYPKILYPYIN